MNPLSSVFDIRVALYARMPLPALQALDKPGIAVCDVYREEDSLPRRIAAASPHVAVFWDRPADFAALAADIAALSPARPPRLISRFPADGIADFSFAEEPHAALQAAMALPWARLARPSIAQREACAARLLREIGMPEALKGFPCTAEGAALLSAMPLPCPPLQQWLYPRLAQHGGISPAAVERRIRSAAESAWLRGNLQAQARLLGFSVSAERGKPTNGELLFRLADCIAETLFPG